MIPNGSNVTYTGTWSAPPGEDNNSVVQGVVGSLQTSGLISRSAPKIDAGWLSNINPLGGSFSVTLALQVQNGLGFGSVDDIISIIRHWVYDSTGEYPTADSISNYTNTSGSVVRTGQPDNTDKPAIGCTSGSSSDTNGNFSISCWFKNLTNQGLSTVGLLAIVAIAGIGLVLWASGKVEH